MSAALPASGRKSPKTGRRRGARRAHLRLLATSDLHMRLTGFDYSADRADPGIGLTRTASLIAEARREAEAEGATVLLFDNGDGLQGTALDDPALGDVAAGGTHALMRAFGYLHYDAIGLGNHDFNYGPEMLDAILRDAPCPVVCTNLRRLEPGLLPVPVTHAILNRALRLGDETLALRIGVLSVLPPQTGMWDKRLLNGRIAITDIVGAVRDGAGTLRRAGCDLVVVLAHSGLGDVTHEAGQENAVIPLAACDGIDAIIAGHTHQQLPGDTLAGLEHVDARAGTVHGRPVVMAGFAGSHLGQIDLTLALDGDGWKITGHQCRARAIARRDDSGQTRALAPEDRGLADMLSGLHERVRADLAQPVGETATPLHSYFCFVTPDPAQHLIAEVQAAAIAPHLPREYADLPLLSATSPGKSGDRAGPRNYTDIAAGPLTRRSIDDLVMFPNHVQAVVVDGAQIRDWLEMSVSLFNRVTPGDKDGDLVDPNWPGHGFDTLFGLSYRIDLSQPPRFSAPGIRAGNRDGIRAGIRAGIRDGIRDGIQAGIRGDDSPGRIGDLRWQGRPVRGTRQFVVALQSYRANGGGHVPALRDADAVALPPMTLREVLLARLSASAPAPANRYDSTPWTFAPMPGCRAVLHTGPGARRHLDDLSARDPRDLGVGADGFLRLRIKL